MASIITLTMNPTVDIAFEVSQVIPNRKLRCEKPSKDPGGGGINVARVVHRLGGNVTAIYLAGGPTANTLSDLLDKENLNQVPLEISGTIRENYIVYEKSSANQFRFGLPGPHIQEHEWEKCLDFLNAHIKGTDFLVASGSLPPGVPDDFYVYVSEIAQRYNIPCIIDTSGPALRQVLSKSKLFLIKPNIKELSYIAGCEPDCETAQQQVAKELISTGRCEVVVISQGKAGALLVTKESVVPIRSPLVPIKSRVGAGDSMVGGILTGLQRGYPLINSVLLGVAAGAAAVTTPGTQLCTKEETEKLFKELKSQAL